MHDFIEKIPAILRPNIKYIRAGLAVRKYKKKVLYSLFPKIPEEQSGFFFVKKVGSNFDKEDSQVWERFLQKTRKQLVKLTL